jgi:hypothetical protein
MKVSELIDELKKHPPDMEVRVPDWNLGTWRHAVMGGRETIRRRGDGEWVSAVFMRNDPYEEQDVVYIDMGLT